jgi:hypothetical protein
VDEGERCYPDITGEVKFAMVRNSLWVNHSLIAIAAALALSQASVPTVALAAFVSVTAPGKSMSWIHVIVAAVSIATNSTASMGLIFLAAWIRSTVFALAFSEIPTPTRAIFAAAISAAFFAPMTYMCVFRVLGFGVWVYAIIFLCFLFGAACCFSTTDLKWIRRDSIPVVDESDSASAEENEQASKSRVSMGEMNDPWWAPRPDRTNVESRWGYAIGDDDGSLRIGKFYEQVGGRLSEVREGQSTLNTWQYVGAPDHHTVDSCRPDSPGEWYHKKQLVLWALYTAGVSPAEFPNSSLRLPHYIVARLVRVRPGNTRIIGGNIVSV